MDEPADVVLASHDHPDHAGTDAIAGHPLVFIRPVSEKVASVRITGIEVDHDETGGSERGKSTIIVVDDGDIRLVHLGDLGHLLDARTVEKIGRVDVLLIPVGGYFTIDAEAAAKVAETLAPRVADDARPHVAGAAVRVDSQRQRDRLGADDGEHRAGRGGDHDTGAGTFR